MKTLKIGAFAILGLLAVACNDDDNNNTAKLSSEEQAEMVASSMGRSGFAGSAEQSAQYADDSGSGSGRLAECGISNNSELDLSGTLGGVSFVYNSDFTLLLECDGNDEPESFMVDFDYQGSYTGPRFESDYSGNGNLTITNLEEAETSYEVNGSYDRDGEFVTKVDGEVSDEGEHNIEINVDNVMVSKSSHEITSGSASVDASGRIDGRGSYSFSADVTFSGSGASRKATIQVAGDTYELNIQSNTLVKTSSN